jgi:hypothetical protein
MKSGSMLEVFLSNVEKAFIDYVKYSKEVFFLF